MIRDLCRFDAFFGTLAACRIARHSLRNPGFDVFPFGVERLDDHGFDDAHDGLRIGVVRTELAALGRIETALEQCAKDGRLNAGPVQPRDCNQRGDVVALQRQCGIAVEQPAVEPVDDLRSEVTAFTHRGEQLFELAVDARRVFRTILQYARDHFFGQQSGIFGEEAEQQFVKEMRYLLRRMPTVAQGVGKRGEQLRGLFGEGARGARRTQFFRLEEQRAQLGEVIRRANFLERDGVRVGYGIGEVGVYLDQVGARHHQQRRIFQCQHVTLYLIQCFAQIAVRAFVFHREKPALPHVRPAVAAAGLGRAFFKTKGVADSVLRGGSRMAGQRAQVVEVLLIESALGELAALPLGDELLRRHAAIP